MRSVLLTRPQKCLVQSTSFNSMAKNSSFCSEVLLISEMWSCPFCSHSSACVLSWWALSFYIWATEMTTKSHFLSYRVSAQALTVRQGLCGAWIFSSMAVLAPWLLLVHDMVAAVVMVDGTLWELWRVLGVSIRGKSGKYLSKEERRSSGTLPQLQ